MHHLITEVQSLGIQVHEDITGRKGGAGPAEGRAFILNGVPVTIPIAASYVSSSPFTLEETKFEYYLLKNGKPVSTIKVVPEPKFYSKTTKDGISYRQIALLHGKDCLATTVLQKCVHWKHSKKCSFCATEASLSHGQTIAKKTPDQLALVAKAARDMDGVTHMVLTSGTGDPPGSEILYLAQCARAIKAGANIPIQVQIAPPKDLGLIDELKDAGVESIGIHIESFDADILSKVAPSKAKIGLNHYEKAWKKAVQLFGVNQVSSFIIAGLGETMTSIAWGSELLADLGVYPFVVPLRPIPGSRLEKSTPPLPDHMKKLYDAVAKILQTKGINTSNILAGCARCGACSALSSYEKKEDSLICHSARNQFEKSEAFRIRKDVFVQEQGLFKNSDIDENDVYAIQLVAKQKGKVIGTVRIYSEKSGADNWIGGRLAIKKDFRATNAGSALVKEAMKRVQKKGCRVFTAHIQEKNIPFFLGLGWKPRGPVKLHLGYPHQKMEANLSLVRKDI
ncbi:MSMEG_0568 family radical SAM protein [Desulfobacula sp.]|uniref:MSMEG_0568 family radical SAM protein n=1 Tax=Desulfobacula sp. TaxID=2593537 RepID=UPI001DB4DCFF|nr:MSMEG_0568 family radical SAM protein [Desulfobacula sp.]